MEMVECTNTDCKKQISVKTRVCECGQKNVHYRSEKKDGMKNQSEFKKCEAGHHIALDDAKGTLYCREPNCNCDIVDKIYSYCSGCGGEVKDGELCERCRPSSKCEEKLEEKKSAEPKRALHPRLECQSNVLFNPEIRNEYVIGREGNINTSCLNNVAISRRHATFIEESGNWFIRDEGSKYGTKINGGDPITPHEKVPLKPNDVITLADEIWFVFKME
jgi:FOG: FHA domain